MRPPAAPRQPRRGPGTETPPAAAHDHRHDDPPASAHDHRRPDSPAAEHDRPVAARGTSGARRWLPVRGSEQPPAHPQAAGGTGFLERLAEQTRARRRLAWRKVLIAVGVLAVLGTAGWAVLVSPLLALDMDDVTVSGVGEGTTVSREEVTAVVAGREGVPLARLDAGALVADLDTITTVRSAQVTRSWPNGLTVEVEARVPVAAASSDDGIVLLDVEGVVVGTADEPPEDLPDVTVPLEGERAGETLAAVLGVLAELPPGLRADVTTAGAGNPASITLELSDGAEVRWGGVAESELKAAVLEVLREREAAVYDVTVPRSPTLSD